MPGSTAAAEGETVDLAELDRSQIETAELGGAAVYLLSPLSSGVTGEIHYVDSGYNIISAPRPEDLAKSYANGED